MNHENPIIPPSSVNAIRNRKSSGQRRSDYIVSIGNELSGGERTRKTPNEAVYLLVACPTPRHSLTALILRFFLTSEIIQ